MVNFTEAELSKIIVHKIGNRNEEEGIVFSEELLKLQGGIIKELLLKFFLSPFTSENFFKFFHESDINLNEVFSFSTNIFSDSKTFVEQSQNLARHLYEKSDHPKIRTGEFYTVEIQNCIIDDEPVNAIGLFKTENKDTYLKVQEKDKNFEIDYEKGININKLDKGCLIFNTEKDGGYLISMVDNVNKSNEAQYWKDNFLKIKPREDNYYFTKNYLEMCKTFAEKGIQGIEKNDQVALKNDTYNFFKEKEEFRQEEFEKEVITTPEVIEMFREYKQIYQDQNDISFSDGFEVSENAVNGAKRIYRSIIKLDKNFHIYVHGDQQKIEKGFDDEKNMKYYTLYFEKES
jgi:hypothetical protein